MAAAEAAEAGSAPAAASFLPAPSAFAPASCLRAWLCKGGHECAHEHGVVCTVLCSLEAQGSVLFTIRMVRGPCSDGDTESVTPKKGAFSHVLTLAL
eukprot:scaffold16298_cov19-Tisochrysis_lutea.AAC.2